MKIEDVQKLRHGLYLVFWVSGCSSLAAVGSDANGNRWLAPTNWVVAPWHDWNDVLRVELIVSSEDYADGDIAVGASRTRVERAALVAALVAALDAQIEVLQAEYRAFEEMAPDLRTIPGAVASLRMATVGLMLRGLPWRRYGILHEQGVAIGEVCRCREAARYMPEIITQQVFCTTQSAGPAYTGPAFRYCPWCSDPREEQGGINAQ